MSEQSVRRRPIPAHIDRRIWQHRLMEALQSTPRYRAVMVDLQPAWEASSRPESSRLDAQLHAALSDGAGCLGLMPKRERGADPPRHPVPWAVGALLRDLRRLDGLDDGYRPDRLPLVATEAQIDVSVTAAHATVEAVMGGDGRQDRYRQLPAERPAQFSEWDALRAEGYAAVDHIVDRLERAAMSADDAVIRNPTAEEKWARYVEALAVKLGGGAGSTITRGQARHVCDLLGIQTPFALCMVRENSPRNRG